MQQVGTWLSLVERTLGVGEVASSNLVVPTITSERALLKIMPKGFLYVGVTLTASTRRHGPLRLANYAGCTLVRYHDMGYISGLVDPTLGLESVEFGDIKAPDSLR
jgi:hypothetical protein